MNTFSAYMNKVKAEEELKGKTAAFVRAALAKEEGQNNHQEYKMGTESVKFAGKRMWVIASSVAACAVLALCGYGYYRTPRNYISLDINPSLELGVNAFDRVVNIEAYNDDGQQLLTRIQYRNLSVEQAVSLLVQQAAQQGFIAQDGSTVVAVTAESNSQTVAAALQSRGEQGVQQAMQAGGMAAVVYGDHMDLALRQEAHEEGISPGKLRLIQALQALDPAITPEQYKGEKVTNIIAMANQLMEQSQNGNWQSGKYAGALEQVRTAAQQVQAAYANTEQEQERNGTQNQSQQSAAQEQEQNQNRSTTRQQTQNPETTPQQGQGETEQVQNRNTQADQQITGGTAQENGAGPAGTQSPDGAGQQADGNEDAPGAQAEARQGSG